MSIPAPLWLIAGGVVFLLLAVKALFSERRTVEVVPYSNVQIELPKKWDDAEITRLLQRHAAQPAVLAHAVSSIRSRMILNQDVKTAQTRLKLISSVIEVFKLNRELQGVLHDLHLEEKEFEIRQVEADTRLEDAQSRNNSEQRLRQLRQQRDELQLQKEIADLGDQLQKIKVPEKPEVKLSPEEQRAKDKAACEAKIATLKQEKQNALKITEETERVLRVNAIDDAIQREMERWAKLL